MKILSIVGARPNFMKVAPLHRAFLADPSVESKIVHTGQHYDARMSEVFFTQLDLPHPDYYLGVGSGTQTQQTADIMLRVEPIFMQEKPDWVLVVGDVTSTLACALVAVRQGIRVAHIEAGLRSGDRQMPEEINRILTDALSDLLFVTEQSGVDNLRREGICAEKIRFVGNVMIDSLVHYRRKATDLNTVSTLGLTPKRYLLMTMHRPANVDTEAGLRSLVAIVAELTSRQPVVFPLHPRTRANLDRYGLLEQLTSLSTLHLLEPQGYLECLNLMEYAAAILTDSGGIQEEASFLNVPCLTLRPSTERPVTVELGTNRLLPNLDAVAVRQVVDTVLSGQSAKSQPIPFWDGHAAERIADCLRQS